VYIRVKQEIDDGFESWPKERQQKVRENQGKVPINIRTLNDIDWEQLKIARTDEGQEGYFVT
jgi:transposase